MNYYILNQSGELSQASFVHTATSIYVQRRSSCFAGLMAWPTETIMTTLFRCNTRSHPSISAMRAKILNLTADSVNRISVYHPINVRLDRWNRCWDNGFQNVGRPPSWIFKNSYFKQLVRLLGLIYVILSNVMRYIDFSIFKMAVVHNLGFSKPWNFKCG